MAEAPSLKDAALGYAERGIPVVPLHPRTKAPITLNGWKNAVTDLEQVEKWWTRDPERNIGTVPGMSGFIATDIDTFEELEAWTRFLKEVGDPDTRIVQSPSDLCSRHYWFAHPGPVEFTKCFIELDGQRILVAGSGQLVVLPPSVHPVGDRYRFLADQKAAVAPDRLLAMITAAPRVHSGGRATANQVDRWIAEASNPLTNRKGEEAVSIVLGEITQAGHGSRHDTLKVSLAGLLNRAAAVEVEIDLEEAIDRVSDKYSALFDASERRHPHKELTELLAWTIGQRLEAGEEPKNEELPQFGTKSRPRSDLTSFTAAELQNMILPKPRAAVPGILPEGLNIIGGKPKLGKSWLMLQMAVAVAGGETVLDNPGRIAESANVLYLALEDGKGRLQERMKLVVPVGSWPGNVHFETAWPRLHKSGIDLLSDFTAGGERWFVVIDTLQKVRPPKRQGSDPYAEDYEALGLLHDLTTDREGLTITVVHHNRKVAVEDYIDALSGSTGLTGQPDTVLVLFRERGLMDATLRVTGRDVAEIDLALQFADGFLWKELGDAAEYRLTRERQEVLEALRDHGGRGRVAQIAQHLGKSTNAVSKLLAALANEGLVNVLAWGHYEIASKSPGDSGG